MSLLPGDIDGIPFFVDDHNGQFGRRYVIHEYPGRDKPFVEDMGRKTRELSINAFVIGVDYMAQRDALIAAAEQPGVKRMTHPWLGRMDVFIELLGVSESTRYGGMAAIELSVVEAGADQFPAQIENTPAATLEQVPEAHQSVMDSFGDIVNFSPSSFLQQHMQGLVGSIDSALTGMIGGMPMPGGLLDSALSAGEAALLGKNPFSAVLGQLSSPAGFVSSLVSVGSGSTGLLSRVMHVGYSRLLRAGALRDLKTTTNFYGGSPVAISARAFSATPAAVSVSAYSARPVTPLRVIQSMEPVALWPALPSGTANKQQAATNQLAVQSAVAQISAIEQARMTAALEYPTKNDAYAVRDYLTSRLAALAKTADYSVYTQLQKLRAAVHKDLTVRGNAYASLTTLRVPDTLSALVLSYQHFGTSTRADELLERNPTVEHPAMIPGGTVLEVLRG